MFRLILGRRILFAILTVSMVIGIAFATSFKNDSVSARPCFSLLKEYYSDATYSVQVGEQYWPCIGQPSQWGTTSSYMISSTDDCGGACSDYP